MYLETLEAYCQQVSPRLLSWKQTYAWGVGEKGGLAAALERRDGLERLVQQDLASFGCVSKRVFDEIMVWGFGKPSKCSEADIRENSRKAFEFLDRGYLAEAATAITQLTGVGIARGSKILALSNQRDFAIYDSHAAHGLSDLRFSGRPLVPIPPGFAVPGDTAYSKADFCREFPKYTWIIRYLRDRARVDPALRPHFRRAADIEIAFFCRSRLILADRESLSAQV